jgi:hypothetical protein
MIVAAAFAAVAAACDETPVEVHRHDAVVAASQLPDDVVEGLTKQVHAVTSRFHSTRQAKMAGYAETPDCVAVPGLGGMGYHWVNASLVDPVFDALRPEVMLYEADRNGNLKLVAVEYIVIDVGQPAPTFAGQPFDVGGTPVPVPHWSLHVWLHKSNPNGLFTPFNPQVSCPAV